jgi:hypothetical protein
MRFHLVRGFKLSGSIEQALVNSDLIDNLTSVSIERVYEELRKCFEYDTWNSLLFLDGHPYLKVKIFGGMGLGLEPVIRSL